MTYLTYAGGRGGSDTESSWLSRDEWQDAWLLLLPPRQERIPAIYSPFIIYKQFKRHFAWWMISVANVNNISLTSIIHCIRLANNSLKNTLNKSWYRIREETFLHRCRMSLHVQFQDNFFIIYGNNEVSTATEIIYHYPTFERWPENATIRALSCSRLSLFSPAIKTDNVLPLDRFKPIISRRNVP